METSDWYVTHDVLWPPFDHQPIPHSSLAIITWHCKSICFPQQINLFSSANQFTFLSKSIYFPQQIHWNCRPNSLKLQTKFIDFTQQIHWICKQTDRFKCCNWLILCGFNDTQKHTQKPTISIATACSHHRQSRWGVSMMPLYILPLSIPRWRAEKYISDCA